MISSLWTCYTSLLISDTSSLNYIHKYHYVVWLSTQTVDPPWLPTKGEFQNLGLFKHALVIHLHQCTIQLQLLLQYGVHSRHRRCGAPNALKCNKPPEFRKPKRSRNMPFTCSVSPVNPDTSHCYPKDPSYQACVVRQELILPRARTLALDKASNVVDERCGAAIERRMC